MDWIKRFFGLKGSWTWAYRQMLAGEIVFRISDSGDAKYGLDTEGQGRIECKFTDDPHSDTSEWRRAYIFLNDFQCVNWAVYDAEKYSSNYRERWRNYGYKQ